MQIYLHRKTIRDITDRFVSSAKRNTLEVEDDAGKSFTNIKTIVGQEYCLEALQK